VKPSFAWVAAAVLLVFGPLLRTPWLWDDKTLIRDSPVLADSSLWLPALTSDFWQLSVNARESGMYRPLVVASYEGDRAVFGSSPIGPHAVNLLLHLLCAWLLYRLALQHGAEKKEAVLASALFSLHPVCVEAVANVASRGDLLATALLLGAFLMLRKNLVAAAVLTLAAQFSKESAFVALALALLLEARDSLDVKRLARVGLAIGGATALAFLVRHFVLQSALRLPGEGGPLLGLTTLGRYAARVVFPAPLVPYQPETVASWLIAAAVFAVGLISLGLLRQKEGATRSLGWTFFWFAAATATVCNWLPVHARFSGLLLYLPLTGVALGVARAAKDLRLTPFLALALGALSVSLSPMWSDDEALWRANAETFPELPAPLINYANALAARSAPETAETYVQTIAASQQAGDTKTETLAEYGLGNWLLHAAPAEAEAHFARAQRASGYAFWQAGLNRAVALAVLNRAADADAVLEEQFAHTPASALAEAGVRLFRDGADETVVTKWAARATLTRPKK
jgi:hypothetical protein